MREFEFNLQLIYLLQIKGRTKTGIDHCFIKFDKENIKVTLIDFESTITDYLSSIIQIHLLQKNSMEKKLHIKYF